MITFVPNFQQTTDIHGLDRGKTLAIVSCAYLELRKMQCACVTLSEKLRGRLNQLCTFPGGHWIRANIQCTIKIAKKFSNFLRNFFENSSVCDSLLRGVILPLLREKVRKPTTKTITGVSLSSLLFAKFMKWCFSTDLKIMRNKMVYFRSCSSDLKGE